METITTQGTAPGYDVDKLKVKTACCPTCKGWVFISAFPQCETSKHSQKEFRACIKAGLPIDVITLRESHALAHCPTQGKCKEDSAPSCKLEFGWLDFGEPLPPVTPCPSGRNDCPSGCAHCPADFLPLAPPTPAAGAAGESQKGGGRG